MDNSKLEKLLEEMKAAGGDEQKEAFFSLLNTSKVIVPAVMPKNTSPEIMRQMLQNAGKEQAIPEGAHPQPCVLENEQKEKFLPVFTSEQELRKSANAPNFPLTLNLDFKVCIDLLQKSKDIKGAVINPYTHNVVFRINEPKQQKEIQVTVEQFHELTRNKLESFYLPKKLFTQKKEIVQKLCEGKGAYVKELYEELYTTEVACPYTEEDFDVMSLNISEDLVLVQIIMPPKYAVANTCPAVFAAWDKKAEKIWYYAIVLAATNQEKQLHELKEDGTHINLGAAPSEGSELSTVLDLIQKA
jgi:hypothetical protein